MAVYSLQEITMSAAEWDSAVRRYRTSYLFHESAWLTYLERTQNGRRLQVAVHEGDRLQGYFCGVVVRKGPFRILGSPLRGWWTPCMGPAVNELDESAFLVALETFCRAKGIDYVELSNPCLNHDSMVEAGYVPEDNITYLVPLASREEMWKRIDPKARNKIRQAERKGVQVEIADNISAVGEYYDQLETVFARQGLTPPHPRKMVHALWDCLYPEGKVIVLRAMYNGRCIASYIGPLDGQVLYGLGWASWSDANSLRPNDVIQWKALTLAAERGLTTYDMCGGGSFKPKFGGAEVPRIGWRKAYSTSARLAREIYNVYWFGRRELLRRLRRTSSEPRARTTA